MSTSQQSANPICRLSQPLPDGTIDTHMHIIPPDFDRFPLQVSAQYKPTPHTLSDALTFYTQTSGLGINTPRLVLTQVSIYGNDNSALLSGLADLRGNGRGVIQCDPATVSVEQLQDWWAQGARGVRINLVSVGRSMDEDELRGTLQAYVDKLVQHDLGGSGRKWVVEMYLPITMVPLFRAVLPRVEGGEKVRWCLDHFGGLKFKEHAPGFKAGDDVLAIPGFAELVEVLADGSLPEVYMKISAQYRMDEAYPSSVAMRRIGAVTETLVQKAEDRVMYASDWPHTRFGDIDSVPFVEVCYEACGRGDQGMRRREKLFRLNAERLWDMA